MKSIAKIFLVSALGGALTLGAYLAFVPQPKVETIIQTQSTPVIKTNSGLPIGESSFTLAAEKTVNSVVHVTTAVKAQNQSISPLDLFFGNSRSYQPRVMMGSGSGVIISKDGFIVTNNHVIDRAQTIKVSLNDNKTYEAKVIGTDPTTDIALIKIKPDDNLPYLTFSNSDNVKLGEWVLAVGNPFNLTSTVTAGIVSAKSRNIGVIEDRAAIESFIQTDAAVNQGNSGGALVNTNGELVGINSAISTHTGIFEGYSFAVPSNIVKKVVEDILEFGTVQRAFIGVNISDITPQIANELDLNINEGVYVGGVTENGAAENAGIRTGDIITAIDRRKVSKSSQLQELIGRKRPGDKVSIDLIRDGKPKKVELTLRNINGTTKVINQKDIDFTTVLGGNFKSLDRGDKARLGITYGVEILDVKSGALADQGIPKGFIITHINRMKIQTPEDINQSVEGMQKDDVVVIQGYLPNGRSKYYAFGF